MFKYIDFKTNAQIFLYDKVFFFLCNFFHLGLQIETYNTIKIE